MMDWILFAGSWILILAGCFFLLVGGLGMLRLPSFYTRLHASGLIDTLGMSLSLLGLAIQVGWSQSAFKIILILVFALISGPATTHALAKAARHHGWSEEK